MKLLKKGHQTGTCTQRPDDQAHSCHHITKHIIICYHKTTIENKHYILNHKKNLTNQPLLMVGMYEYIFLISFCVKY